MAMYTIFLLYRIRYAALGKIIVSLGRAVAAVRFTQPHQVSLLFMLGSLNETGRYSRNCSARSVFFVGIVLRMRS